MQYMLKIIIQKKTEVIGLKFIPYVSIMKFSILARIIYHKILC